MLKKDDTLIVDIIKQDHFGNGIAKVNNFLIFVENGLPLDRALIKIININKSYAKAKIIKLLKKAKIRVKPICKYYDLCGGCHIMHEKYQDQLKFKQDKVLELFTRNFKDEIKINKIIANQSFNYRNKVTLHVKDGKMGYYQNKTNVLVAIDKCELLHPLINEYLMKINKLLNKDTCEIIIRVSNYNKEVLININGKFQNIDKLKNENISLYYNDELIKGSGYIVEKINDMYFGINQQSFFQVNTNIAAKLYNLVIDLSKNHDNVLDLYCGVGGIGLLVSKVVKQVIGIEINASAIKEANKNKDLNKVNNINFINGDVKDKIKELKAIDLIIVDPPREGLNQRVIDSILKIKPQEIIYISCDLNTLIRDIKKITSLYKLVSIDIFDMFPNTYHVECVCLLNLSKSNLENS